MPLPSSRAAAAIACIVSGVWVSVACGVICGRIRPSSAPFQRRPKARFAAISASVPGTESNSAWSLVRNQIGNRRWMPGIIPPG